MNFLSVEASSNYLIIAAQKGDSDVGLVLHNAGKHGSLLISGISTVMDFLELKVADLDFVGCGIGPGSLTGLRVGISSIKGLIYPFGLPVVPLCSLDLLATGENGEKVAVIRQGRAGYYYWRIYEIVDDSPLPIDGPGFDRGDDLKKLMGDLGVTPITETEREAKEFVGPKSKRAISIPPQRLLQLTLDGYNGGSAVDSRDLKPLYLQRSVAEINWDKLHS